MQGRVHGTGLSRESCCYRAMLSVELGNSLCEDTRVVNSLGFNGSKKHRDTYSLRGIGVFTMFVTIVLIIALAVVGAQDSVATELSKVLKRSRYFVAKLEMVADELQVGTEALKDGVRNLSYVSDDCGFVNGTNPVPSSGIDFGAKAGRKVLKRNLQ